MPKRAENIDTIAYFGEPCHTYSPKNEINDGFLTPFRVKQITTTLDGLRRGRLDFHACRHTTASGFF